MLLTTQQQVIYDSAKQLVRYFEDQEFHDEMERRAQLETAGNVSWFEAVCTSIVSEAEMFCVKGLDREAEEIAVNLIQRT